MNVEDSTAQPTGAETPEAMLPHETSHETRGVRSSTASPGASGENAASLVGRDTTDLPADRAAREESHMDPQRDTHPEVRQETFQGTHEDLLRRAATQMPIMLRIMKLVAKRVMAEYAPRMAALGEGQARVLQVLYDDGSLQVGELASRCGVADPTVSKMLKSLAHADLIERETDPNNRRAVWVHLTAKGHQLFDEMHASFEQGMEQVLGELNDDQLRDLLRTMEHLERIQQLQLAQAGSSGGRPHPQRDVNEPGQNDPGQS